MICSCLGILEMLLNPHQHLSPQGHFSLSLPTSTFPCPDHHLPIFAKTYLILLPTPAVNNPLKVCTKLTHPTVSLILLFTSARNPSSAATFISNSPPNASPLCTCPNGILNLRA